MSKEISRNTVMLTKFRKGHKDNRKSGVQLTKGTVLIPLGGGRPGERVVYVETKLNLKETQNCG